MVKVRNVVLQLLAVVVVGFNVTGCASLQEGFASQMEVPTLEKQANRVAIGMTIVRENNIMAFNRPISADAVWPSLVSADLNDTQEENIAKLLQEGPYFATVHYTEGLQRRMLGSSASLSLLGNYANIAGAIMNQTISPLTYKAIQKLEVFYGEDPKNWPNVFNYDSTLDNFLEFKDGTMLEVEALSGDVYPTLGAAMISLTPINMQKDLTLARIDMLEGFKDVAALKSQKGQAETALKVDIADSNDDKKKDYTPLSAQEKLDMKNEIEVLDAKINEAESLADEKETIYFTLLDEAVVALQSDINIDDENYVKLARNVNIVANEIQTGSTQAYTSFALALANIGSSNIIMNFPTELRSLAIGKAHVPSNLQKKYNQRIARLVKNAVYLLPNMFIGTYYASKQASLADKYQAVTEIIMLAYEVKIEQEQEAKEALEEQEKEVATKG